MKEIWFLKRWEIYILHISVHNWRKASSRIFDLVLFMLFFSKKCPHIDWFHQSIFFLAFFSFWYIYSWDTVCGFMTPAITLMSYLFWPAQLHFVIIISWMISQTPVFILNISFLTLPYQVITTTMHSIAFPATLNFSNLFVVVYFLFPTLTNRYQNKFPIH